MMWNLRFARAPVSSRSTASGWTSASPLTGAIEMRVTVATTQPYVTVSALPVPGTAQRLHRKCAETSDAPSGARWSGSLTRYATPSPRVLCRWLLPPEHAREQQGAGIRGHDRSKRLSGDARAQPSEVRVDCLRLVSDDEPLPPGSARTPERSLAGDER